MDGPANRLKNKCPAYFEYYQKHMDKTSCSLDSKVTPEDDATLSDSSDNLDYTKESIDLLKSKLASCLDEVSKSMESALKDSERFSYAEKKMKRP